MRPGTCIFDDPAQGVPLVQGGVPQSGHFDGRDHQARRCTACGHVYFDPPPAAELDRYYNESYGPSGQDSWYNLEADSEPGKVAYRSGRVIDIAARFGFGTAHRFHEIGCAFGGTVQALNRAGFTATGTDLNADAIAQATAAGNAALGTGTGISFLTERGLRPHVVYGYHVLEHMADPVGYLRALRACLAEDAIVIMFVPNAMVLHASIYGFMRYPWFAYPEHLTMFAPGSAPCYARQVGYDLLDIQTATGAIEPELLGAAIAPRLGSTITRALFERMVNAALAGEELVMVLTPSGSALASRFPAERAVAERLCETNRGQETALRQLGETAGVLDRDAIPPVEPAAQYELLKSLHAMLAAQIRAADTARAAETAAWHDRRSAEIRLAAIENSRFWRMTALPRRLAALLRRPA